MQSPQNDPPHKPAKGARQDAVTLMLDILQEKFKWESGWDDRHEDHYDSGEMTSYRRIEHRVMKDNMFIFIEYGALSACMIYAAGECLHTTEVEEFNEAVAAFDDVERFKELVQKAKSASTCPRLE